MTIIIPVWFITLLTWLAKGVFIIGGIVVLYLAAIGGWTFYCALRR